MDARVGRDLLRVGAVLERLGEDAAVEPVAPPAMPSRARIVGATSTLPTGVRTVVRFLKSAPQARNVLRTFHGLMLPWSLA